MSYIPDALRKKIIEQAKSHCEYCLIHQHDTYYTHEIDHIIPEKHRGKTDKDNFSKSQIGVDGELVSP